MPTVELRRQAVEADRAAVAALSGVAGPAGHAALSEARWIELDRELHAPGTVPGFAALVVADPRSTGLLAYGQLHRGPAAWDLEVLADPAAPGGRGELRAAVVRRALQAVAEAGGGPLQWFVPVAGPDDDRLAGAVGLAPGRELVQLRRPLPLEPDLAKAAERVATRPFRPGRDEAAWLAVNNAAFAAHPDQGSWDEATLAAHEAQDWFDPAGLLLAEEAGHLVGFCWTKHTAEDPETGEIYVIGVAPGLQGRGLGAALLAAGCAHLAGCGARTVTLYVDGDNAPAQRLYRSAGFVVDHVDRVYAGDVAPDLAVAPGCGGGGR